MHCLVCSMHLTDSTHSALHVLCCLAPRHQWLSRMTMSTCFCVILRQIAWSLIPSVYSDHQVIAPYSSSVLFLCLGRAMLHSEC